MTNKDKRFVWKDGVSLEKHFNSELDALRREAFAAIDHQKETTNKAEQAQKDYNILHNDVLRKIDTLKENFITNKEMDEFKRQLAQDNRANVATILAVLSLLLGIAGFILR